MGLPVQKAPEYFCELPLSEIKVKFRPFLVSEQRNLVLMQEGENQAEIFNAIASLINAVTFGEVDAGKLPIGDLEYLFLQIRGKSVGETIEMRFTCATEDCGNDIDVKVDIADVNLKTDNLPDPKIQLSETLGVVMKYPNASIQQKLESNDSRDAFMTIVKNSIDQIFDEDDVYDLIDYADREVDTFIESLTVQQLEMLSSWVETMPTLEHDIKYKCEKCKKDHLINVKGLESFF